MKDFKIANCNFAQLKNIQNDIISFSFDKALFFIGAKERGVANNIDKNHIKILGNTEECFLEAFIRSFKCMNAESIENTEIADWFTSNIIDPTLV